MGFPLFPQDLEHLHIQKDTMSMPYVNTMEELEDSVENCTAFKDKVQSLIYANPIKFKKLVNGHQEH